jgi:phage major head subunit gpT-like protein
MGASSLGSRAIIGAFYNELQAVEAASWVNKISMLFDSNQESETYKWLGMVPQMREWVGGRQAKGFRDNGITITNKLYEATLEVLVDEIRRDKTGQVMLRVAEMARRAEEHWAYLLSALIAANGTCYDAVAFFSGSHTEGSSGTQDNDLTSAATTGTDPTAAEMEAAIMDAVEAMLGFLDDQGQPMNAGAREFLVMIPPAYLKATCGALGSTQISSSSALVPVVTSVAGMRFDVAVNPFLTAWTANFAVFRTDGRAKPFIRQEEVPITVEAIAEGSEEEFKNNRHLYGVKATRNVGLGYWQFGVLHTFT